MFYRDVPPSPPKLPITISSTGQSERALRRQGVCLGRVKGGQPGIGGASRRLAASAGLMLLTVAGSLYTDRIRRGSKGRGEHYSAIKGNGGMTGCSYGRDSEGE